MIKTDDLKYFVVRPALESIGMWSLSAENLVLGTIAQESHMGFWLKQNKGIAFGVCQMESATYDDIWTRYLTLKPKIKQKVMRSCNFKEEPVPETMISDLKFAVIMCRLKYWMTPAELPHEDDLQSLAEYWKEYYNTPLGKGSVEEFVQNYKRFIK